MLITGSFPTAPPTAQAQATAALTTLQNFTGIEDLGPNGLVLGSDGNFYGSTYLSGSKPDGAIFQLTPAGGLTTLHVFTGGSDGRSPSKLVQGGDGNFYGTTFGSATVANGDFGTVFQVTLSGVFTTLYAFTGGSDGANPSALALGSDGSLYGTTRTGGATGFGTVFRATTAGVPTTLYNFPDDSTGQRPDSALTLGHDGNFYGTTYGVGATSAGGTAFQMTPTGTVTSLHDFANNEVLGGLIAGGDGNLYGWVVTTVFQLTPAGAYTAVYTFSDNEGYYAEAMVLGSDGNLYVTTFNGGTYGEGAAYQLTLAGVLTSLYNFSGSDGVELEVGGPLVEAGHGRFFGTTSMGGSNGGGTFFALAVTAHPAFFTGQAFLGNGVYYLAFANGNYFGYYTYLSNPDYLYHFDLGYEYVFDAADGKDGVYLYDFASNDFFYTSPVYPFPYLYDLDLNAVLYYYPDTGSSGHYTTNPRYFFDFATGQIITK